jgi:hypothetical protein
MKNIARFSCVLQFRKPNFIPEEEPDMADEVRKIAYFAMDVPDKPGEAARVLTTLADAGVNLLAFSGFPQGRKAQLDFIPEDSKAFAAAARKAKLTMRPKKLGFLVQGEDRRGAVAELLKLLADKNINVTAIDAVSSGAGRYGAILWVQPKEVNKAAKALGAK